MLRINIIVLKMEESFIMKATGIVRRIDELGRIVVPKEIRRTLRIREGDPLEIFTDKDGEIILKKYDRRTVYICSGICRCHSADTRLSCLCDRP